MPPSLRCNLAPSLAALLEDVALTLTRRGPDTGKDWMQAYRLARALTNGLGLLLASAANDPDVGRFVTDYVDTPRREQAELIASSPLFSSGARAGLPPGAQTK